jgi:hypothetical protein
MQRPRDNEAAFQDPLKFAENMVDAFADGARLYWRLWGPLGEPMIRGVDAWADMQRAYLAWMREAYRAGGRS